MATSFASYEHVDIVSQTSDVAVFAFPRIFFRSFSDGMPSTTERAGVVQVLVGENAVMHLFPNRAQSDAFLAGLHSLRRFRKTIVLVQRHQVIAAHGTSKPTYVFSLRVNGEWRNEPFTEGQVVTFLEGCRTAVNMLRGIVVEAPRFPWDKSKKKISERVNHQV